MIDKTVGAISDSHHDGLEGRISHLEMYRNGTKFVVWAVLGFSRVHISSQFQWSAVISKS